MRTRAGRKRLLRTALAAGLIAVRPVSAGTADNGAFRFLTLSLPDGSTNAEYVARVPTANADGPVVFTITGLAPGMAYDPASGFITGRPTVVGNYHVDITATDGINTITQNNVPLKVNAARGGGNAGATFNVNSLPNGTVGVAYSTTLTVTNGVGPYTFGAVDLPPGITLNGRTGVLSGTPLTPGTFFCGLSVYDAGENNKVVKVVPLLVEPAASAFQFTTRFLNNGEVGTVYWDQWSTSGGTGPVGFGASGLPPGLSVDPAAGVVSGSPTVAGTFSVTISATDNTDTISTNLQMVIVPSSTSNLYWDFFGLPTGFVGEAEDKRPCEGLVDRPGNLERRPAHGHALRSPHGRAPAADRLLPYRCSPGLPEGNGQELPIRESPRPCPGGQRAALPRQADTQVGRETGRHLRNGPRHPPPHDDHRRSRLPVGRGVQRARRLQAGPRLPQDRLRRLQGRPQGRRCGQGLGNAFPLPGRSEFPLRE